MVKISHKFFSTLLPDDEKNDKNTYVTMYGLEESKKIVEKLSNEAIELFEGFGEKSEFLIKLTKYLIRREF